MLTAEPPRVIAEPPRVIAEPPRVVAEPGRDAARLHFPSMGWNPMSDETYRDPTREILPRAPLSPPAEPAGAVAGIVQQATIAPPFQVTRVGLFSSSAPIKTAETILADFNNDITTAERESRKGSAAARSLYNQLKKEIDDFLATSRKREEIPPFINKMKALVMPQIEALEKDLGWGDYLQNMLKRLCN